MYRTSMIAVLGVVTALALAPLAGAAEPNATVKWKAEKQEIDGFGGSDCFWQAENVMKLAEPDRTEVLDLLFSTTKGAGISIIRNCIGESLPTPVKKEWAGNNATIEPKEGQWNWTGDEGQIWMMKEAKKRGCTRFMSSAWSPPAWMKTNNSVINGGNLKKDKYRAYAEYLAEYVNGYKRHHDIDIYAVSPQNEPTFTGNYPCCQWSAQDFLELTKNHIAPVWKEKNVPAKFMLGEHMFWDESFAVPSLNDPEACARVDIVAAHGYGAPNGFGALPVTTAKGKRIWETEVYNNATNFPDGGNSIGNALYWAEYIHNHMTVSQTSAWLCWWLVAQAKFEGTLITVGSTADPTIDPKLAAFSSPVITRATPGQAVDVDVDITGDKKLYLVIDMVDDFRVDHADWAEPRLVGPKGEMKLTDLKWVKATASWGTPQVNKHVGGTEMILGGAKVPYGIGTHAASLIEYDLPQGYTRFKARAGLDDTCVKAAQHGGGTIRVQVFTKDPFDKASTKPYIVYPRLWAVGNFSRFVRPGWVRVDATPQPAPGVLVSAYKNPASNDFAIVTINKDVKEQDLSVSLEGASSSEVTPYRTSATEKLDKLPGIRFDQGMLRIRLAPQSVTTLVGKAK